MPEPKPRRREFRVAGINVNLLSMRQAMSAIVAAARQGHGFCVFTLNLDHCAKLRSDPKFLQAYRRARFVTADGFPIAVLGRLNGLRVRRTTGADLVEPLCAQAARHDLPVFLLGPGARVLRRAQAHLHDRIVDLDVAGCYAPGPNFDPESIDADVAIECIRQSGARLCLLAIGAPRQEIFAARCLDRLPGVGLICVGAALDFLAGTQKRAPRLVRALWLEWLWRLSSDPRRLAARYLRCAAAIPRLAVEAISIRRGHNA